MSDYWHMLMANNNNDAAFVHAPYSCGHSEVHYLSLFVSKNGWLSDAKMSIERHLYLRSISCKGALLLAKVAHWYRLNGKLHTITAHA